MPEQAYYGFGDALEVAYDTALADWRRMYARSVPMEELFAGPIQAVHLTVALSSAGRANVVVAVTGRRARESDVFFFLMQRHENLWTFPNQDLADPQR